MRVRALTLTQPWATLVAIGAKKIETRSWHTFYRGPLVIHASKTFPAWAIACTVREPFRSALGVSWRELPLGAALAVCRMVSCMPTELRNNIPEPEHSFGDFAPGRAAWLLDDVHRFPEPLSMRGMQGLWWAEIPDAFLPAALHEGRGVRP